MKSKVSGVWKDSVPQAKVLGGFKPTKLGWVRVGGEWRIFYPAYPYYLDMTVGNSGNNYGVNSTYGQATPNTVGGKTLYDLHAAQTGFLFVSYSMVFILVGDTRSLNLTHLRIDLLDEVQLTASYSSSTGRTTYSFTYPSTLSAQTLWTYLRSKVGTKVRVRFR